MAGGAPLEANYPGAGYVAAIGAGSSWAAPRLSSKSNSMLAQATFVIEVGLTANFTPPTGHLWSLQRELPVATGRLRPVDELAVEPGRTASASGLQGNIGYHGLNCISVVRADRFTRCNTSF